MQHLKRILSLFLLAVIGLSLRAAALPYQFIRLDTGNSGLSYDGISRIFQDSRGFIWIGTFKGLNRYDGTRFRVSYKDALGLDSDFIHTIVEDNDGNLWIGTDNGLTRYLYAEDRFEAFTLKADSGSCIRNKVTFIYIDRQGRIWIVANYQGCFCYDPSDGSLVQYRSAPHGGAEYNTDETSISFRRMVEDQHGGFWVSKYHHGLFYAADDLFHLRQIEVEGRKDYFDGDEVEQMWMLGERLLVASNLHGLSLYDPSSHRVETLFSLPDGVTLVDAFLEANENVWLCTTDGVWKYPLCDGEAVHIESGGSDPLALSDHYVFTAFVDREGGLWLGTKDGGVCYSGASQRNISKVISASGESLAGGVVTGFSAGDAGTVWVTTETDGLLRYSPSSADGSVRVRASGLPSDLCCSCYDDGQLWLGSLDGLYRYDTAKGRVRIYGPLKRSAGGTDPRVYRIFRTSGGDVYFSNTLGLFRYLRDSDDFLQIPDFDGVFVTSLCEASDGTFWVSSYAQGLLHYDPAQNVLLGSYRMGDGSNLPSDKISSVFTDADGNVWVVGFSCGISRLGSDGKFTVFDMENCSSMPSNVFFGAVQDVAGNMWLSSDKGLVRFSSGDMSFCRFSVFDGFLDTKLTNSLMMSPSGEIFVGSDNGFVHFDPFSLSSAGEAPDVIISRMGIGDRTLKGNVDLMKSLKLKASENSFGFQFSLMSFTLPGSMRVKCLLEGYDNGWRDVTAGKSVFFFNVPSGTYQLRVMSSADGTSWRESHAPLTITVSPRFFLSPLGVALIILLLALMVTAAAMIVSHRQKAISRAEEEAIRKETEEESMRDKMNFFSHVVHEIKTPLTLIKTPLQSVMSKDQFDDDSRHDLEVMQKNTDYLNSLVGELLEFIRVEKKGYVLNCETVNLIERLSAIVFNYQDTAANTNIRLTTDFPADPVWVSADLPALDKILNNILINALKHADTEIAIAVRACGDGRVTVDISNDGDVIPEDLRDDVFKPFVQYHDGGNKLRKGVGIGLPLARSLSRMHSGDLELLDGERTCFRVTLPVTDAPEGGQPDSEADEESVKRSGGAEDSSPVLLVVDDNDEMRDFIFRKLGADYSIMTARNASEALRILDESNVDLMVTDISMPGKDGLQLSREVRSNVEISHLPIIILSARSSVESKIQAMEAGADLYIEKPFDLDYLRISIRNILDRRSLMRKAVGGGASEVDITMFGLPKRDEEFFQNFDRIIMENISNADLSNDFIAGKLNVSQATMIRKIRKMLNTSPSSYVRTKRLSLAAKMLRESHGNNVSDICYGVGFTNQSYFAKCFKEQYGVTPSEWSGSGV